MSKSGSDLNWIYFERDLEVGRIADQNWIGSVISCKKATRICTKGRLHQFRSDPLLLVLT